MLVVDYIWVSSLLASRDNKRPKMDNDEWEEVENFSATDCLSPAPFFLSSFRFFALKRHFRLEMTLLDGARALAK